MAPIAWGILILSSPPSMLVPDAETILDAADLARDINQALLLRSLIESGS
jgi:hypothetical protein